MSATTTATTRTKPHTVGPSLPDPPGAPRLTPAEVERVAGSYAATLRTLAGAVAWGATPAAAAHGYARRLWAIEQADPGLRPAPPDVYRWLRELEHLPDEPATVGLLLRLADCAVYELNARNNHG